MMEGKACIISYNSRGFGNCKKEFVKDLVNIAGCQASICNQENFVLKKNAYMVTQTLPHHKIIFKEAVKSGFDGRPKNGMFIAIPKNLKTDAIKDVSPESYRIQSVTVKVGTYKFLLLNTYFPTNQNADTNNSHQLPTVDGAEDVQGNDNKHLHRD